MKRKLAFTLIELLVVIAVIGILSGLIVVSMSGTTTKAKIAKSQIFSNSLRNSLMSNIISQYTFDDITDYNTTTKIINSTVGNIPDSWASYSAQAYGGPTLKEGSDCVSEKCVYFDGSDDYLYIPYDLIGNLTSLTFEAWVNGQQTANIVRTNGNPFLLHYKGAGFYLTGSDGTTSNYLGWVTVPENNVWTHVTATWDGSTMSLYVNGLKQSTTLAFTGGVNKKLSTASSFVQIGYYFNAGQPYFKGFMDNIRFYNAPISISQIKQNYISGLNSLLINGGITKEAYKKALTYSTLMIYIRTVLRFNHHC